jgi:hypothetical protein
VQYGGIELVLNPDDYGEEYVVYSSSEEDEYEDEEDVEVLTIQDSDPVIEGRADHLYFSTAGVTGRRVKLLSSTMRRKY